MKTKHALLEEFAQSFGDAHHALLLPIYKPNGRETAPREVSSVDVARKVAERGHSDVRYVESFDEAVEAVKTGVQPGDVVLTMGAGDVTELSDRLTRELGAE